LNDVSGEVDAVILATPPHVRPRLAEEASRAGLHVLCEKPLANSSKEGQEIVAAAERTSRVLSVCHTCRFFPNRIYVANLLEQEQLGRISRVEVEQGSPYDWPTKTGYTMRRDIVNGGVVLNEGLHTLDTLFWWFGRPETFHYEDDAVGGLESNARISMRFPGGISVACRISRTCRLSNQIRLEGDRGVVVLDLYDPSRVSQRLNGQSGTHDVAPDHRDFCSIVTAQLGDFAESIVNRRRPRVTGEDGVQVLAFIERCYAMKRARPLPSRSPLPGLTW
jgi:predicted dehydrogenase